MAVGAAADVKSRLSIVDVVGETVALKKAGQAYKGLCPFHGEKTPSFVVTPARESWKCFGCGLGGDIFSFVMQRDGVPFPEALKTLAAKAGVELDERSRREDSHKARLRDVLGTAFTFYHDVLWLTNAGKPALEYLRGRGFTDDTIERFGLGYAPGGWDNMARRLIEKRAIRAEELADVGLTTPGRRGPIDKFRDRVVFPIRDASGQPVGLGGRLLPAPAGSAEPERDRGPKYLNSPATPLFDKSRTLYLIDRAKATIRRTGRAVIVEGYTDALMAHQAGFSDVVASLGTALTPGQIALLTRYAKDHELHIGLAYDVDPAGQSAGAFGIRELQQLISDMQKTETGMSVGIVRLPEGKDPDEVVREDPERWRDATSRLVGIVESLIDREADRRDIRTTEGRRQVVEAVLPVLHEVHDPVTRGAYLQHLSRRTGVDAAVLEDARRAWRPGAPGRGGSDHGGARLTVESVRAASESFSPEEVIKAVTPVEAELLRLLLLLPDEQPRVADELGPDQLPSTVARELFRAIVDGRAPDDRGIRGSFDRTTLLGGLDDETRALAVALLARPGPDPSTLAGDKVRYEIENLLLDLEADRLEERVQYNLSEQADAERRGEADQMERLLNQQRAINEERRSLDRRREQARLFSRPVAART